MSTRICLYIGGSLFTAALALAFADQWVAAGLLVAAFTYVAGRCDRERRIAELSTELSAVKARERRLDDELNDLHQTHRAAPSNGAGHLSPAALLDIKTTTATTDSGVPAPARATNLP